MIQMIDENQDVVVEVATQLLQNIVAIIIVINEI
jgi:hypothetical protein